MSNAPTYSAVPQGTLGLGEPADKAAGKGVLALAGLIFASGFIAIFAALWLDRPKRVLLLTATPKDGFFTNLARWWSWSAWTFWLIALPVAPAVSMSQAETAHPSPLAALSVGAATVFLYVWHLVNYRRWVAHRAGMGIKIRMVYGDIALALKPGRLPHNFDSKPFVPGGVYSLLGLNILPLVGFIIWPGGWVLGFILSYASFIFTLFVMVRATHLRGTWAKEDHQLTVKYVKHLAAITGLNAATEFDAATHLHLIPGGNGGFTMQPTPAALALKFTPAGRAAIDQGLAMAMPELMLGDDSDDKITYFLPVSAERLAARQVSAQTEGRATGIQDLEDLGEQGWGDAVTLDSLGAPGVLDAVPVEETFSAPAPDQSWGEPLVMDESWAAPLDLSKSDLPPMPDHAPSAPAPTARQERTWAAESAWDTISGDTHL